MPPVLLYADDDPDDFLILSEALTEAGWSVDVRFVQNGEELMDYLYRRGRYAEDAPRPDLLLLDLSMPGRSGTEVLEDVRSEPGLRSIPVVIFTGSLNPEDVAACYDLGANSYVRKPSTYEEMVQVLNSLARYWFDIALRPR